MYEYYFSLMTRREQGFYKKLLNAIENGKTEVGPVLMSSDEIAQIVEAISLDHPELFTVDFKHLSFAVTPIGTTLQLRYLIGTSQRQIVQDNINKKVSKIIESANEMILTNDLYKVRWIHKYFVSNIHYNYDAYYSVHPCFAAHTVEGVFNENSAVCEGIAKAFKMMCDQLDVKCLVVSGTSSLEGMGNNIPHAWNIVIVDEVPCQIDVTWDINLSETSNSIRYDYFCISDSYMKADHIYHGYPACETNQYSFFSQKNCWFKKPSDLQSYLQREISQGKKVLYFKAENKNTNLEIFCQKIQNQVWKAIGDFSRTSVNIQMSLNKNQKCFFFRLIS